MTRRVSPAGLVLIVGPALIRAQTIEARLPAQGVCLGPVHNCTSQTVIVDLQPDVAPGLCDLRLLVDSPGVYGACAGTLSGVPHPQPLRVLETQP